MIDPTGEILTLMMERLYAPLPSRLFTAAPVSRPLVIRWGEKKKIFFL
jgi:hypothetical protein